MSIRKTIGGDRLGAGKKMTVDLKGYNRSTHDLSYIWRSTMAAGTLVPFMTEIGLPGDTFDIDLDVDIKTHPTIGPLFGSYKIQLDVFQCPIRLYQGQLHNNKLGIGMNMANIKLPLIVMDAPDVDLTKNLDNQHINPSSILSYLNIRGLGKNKTSGNEAQRNFNAVPYLSYWDIYKNYYANKQEEVGAVIHSEPKPIVKTVTDTTAAGTIITYKGTRADSEGVWVMGPEKVIYQISGVPPDLEDLYLITSRGKEQAKSIFYQWSEYETNIEFRSIKTPLLIYGWDYADGTDIQDNSPKMHFFPLENLDEMRENILSKTKETQAVTILDTSIEPYNLVLKKNVEQTIWAKMSSQEGLALKTYQSDLFNNWLSTEWIDGDNGINAITAIDTSDGNFTIDTLNLSKKVYDMLNRIAVSGGTYDDWLDAVYGEERSRRATSPMYMGGLMRELVFQEVVSNAEAGGDTGQPLGTLAGKGIMGGKKKGGKITVKVDEPCYIMGIISLTPRVDYSQGNKWDVNLKTMDDLHKPAMDEIGFQDLITDQMAWWDTDFSGFEPEWETVYKSAGKQPAWINYMTNVNQVRGNFAIDTNEMFMTLNRRYEHDPITGEIMDLTTYIDPMKFNHIFAQTSRDAQNFWAQISLDIKARRKMSAKIMPNL